MASQITYVWLVYLTVCSGADEWKHRSSGSLAFVRGIHRGPVPHKGAVTRKTFPLDDVIVRRERPNRYWHRWHLVAFCCGLLMIIEAEWRIYSKLTAIGIWTIIWTNAGIVLIEPFGTNFSQILIEVYTFSARKMHFKTSSGKWRLFCLGLNVLPLIAALLDSLQYAAPLPVNLSWWILENKAYKFEMN